MSPLGYRGWYPQEARGASDLAVMVGPVTVQPAHHAASIRRRLETCPEGLSATDRLLLVVVMLHSDSEGYATVSRGRLAKLSGVSERHVKRCLQKLRDEGLLGAPVLTSDGSGYRTYRHPILMPVGAVLEAPGSDLQEEFWKAENERLDEVQKAFDQVPF